MRERSWRFVPKSALWVLFVALIAQLIYGFWLPKQSAKADELHPPPSKATAQLTSLGESIVFAKLMMLYLQAFDNQPGISIPFRQLDYNKVQLWLKRILELDPQGQYPLFFASHLYAEVSDKAKQRQMAEFVYEEFLLDPNRRWPWMAHLAIMAKHRLKDLPLALKYARAMREHAIGNNVPHWAQQMEIFVLEEMNEFESAKVLIGGLLESGKITDINEGHFLSKRLTELEKKTRVKLH